MQDGRDDAALLREHAATASPQALGELARRHAGMVYAAARRQVGDPHLAEDVTQAVFILLIAKARAIQNPAHLVGWLHATTRRAAANARRMEARRKYHETKAAATSAAEHRMEHARRENASDEAARWEELSPVIDAALAELGERDRQSILLRYVGGKGVPEVAAAMNVSHEAAKKRLTRGLEKLRKRLADRGIVITTAVLTTTLLASSASEAAAMPPMLQQTIGALVTGQSAASSSTAMAIACKTAAISKRWSAIAASVAIIAGAAFISLLATQKSAEQIAAAAPAAPADVAPPSQPPAAPIPAAAAPTPGWPIILSGAVTGSPTPVDLDGDGKPEIVVPYMGMIPGSGGGAEGGLLNGRKPDLTARVGAFHLDGSPVDGFPVVLMTAENHKAARPAEFPNWWLSTPAVLDASGGEPGVIVIGHPGGPNKADRGVSVIRGDGKHVKLPSQLAMPDPGSTLTLVDLDGAGTPNVIVGSATCCTIDGVAPRTWTGKKLPSGFSISAGDVNGDGKLELFLVTQRHGASNASIVAVDHAGQPLAGWPQRIGAKSFAAPSLGNVFGDSKMEIVVPDFHKHLLAWTADGKQFGRTFTEAEGHGYSGGADGLSPSLLELEKCTSIFKDNIDCAGPAALADLDGDGLAEIIVVDADNETLCAWHGDGSSAFAGDADGLIAKVGPGNVRGVSVAGPDDNGAYDFFAGTRWVHRDRDGKVDVRDMVPGKAATPVNTMCQDTICDLDGDGQADILIGTEDGRVIVYKTGIKYTARWAQWPTQGGNRQRTGCWMAAARK